MSNKKTIQYYLSLDWTYTIESETDGNHKYFIIRVNELPGICTDAETVAEGMELIKECIEGCAESYLESGEEMPEPIKKDKFKGNISYRTTKERHYSVARVAKRLKKSTNKTIDMLIDAGMQTLG